MRQQYNFPFRFVGRILLFIGGCFVIVNLMKSQISPQEII